MVFEIHNITKIARHEIVYFKGWLVLRLKNLEDFGFFTTKPYIPSVYFAVGGTPKKDFEIAKKGGKKVGSHHSPQFKISPEPSVKAGVEATVLSLLELMPKK